MYMLRINNRLPLLILCLSLSAPAHALAQSATTGAIAGEVKDATGAVLPGVTVEAASPALIEKVPHGRHRRPRALSDRGPAPGCLHRHGSVWPASHGEARRPRAEHGRDAAGERRTEGGQHRGDR